MNIEFNESMMAINKSNKINKYQSWISYVEVKSTNRNQFMMIDIKRRKTRMLRLIYYETSFKNHICLYFQLLIINFHFLSEPFLL